MRSICSFVSLTHSFSKSKRVTKGIDHDSFYAFDIFENSKRRIVV